jgi:hypothetical protein
MAMLNMNGDADDDAMRDLDEGTAARRPRGYRGAVGLANLGAFVRASLTRCVADVRACQLSVCPACWVASHVAASTHLCETVSAGIASE